MTTKQTTTNTNDIATLSKEMVTKGRIWATTVRDATWAPWLGMVERNETLATMVRPWVDMTRTAHDRWLELYETQAHEMIDRTYHVMDRIRP